MQPTRSTKYDNEEQNLEANPAKELILWYAVQLTKHDWHSCSIQNILST